MTDEELIKRLRSPHGGNWLTDLAADRIEQLNAKLAEAVETLEHLVALNDDYILFGSALPQDRVERTWRDARTTLAELKGQNDD
jgi:hypothetical protein